MPSGGATVTVNIPDFRRQLKEVSNRVERSVTTRAVRAAGIVFRTEARQIAPVLSPTSRNRQRVAGALVRAIFVGRSRFQKRGEVRFFVGVRASRKNRGTINDPFYWRFLEAGWMPRGRGKALRGGNRSKALQRQRAAAGGARRVAYPFLQPAFDRSKGRALQAFIGKMEEGFAKEVNRVR